MLRPKNTVPTHASSAKLQKYYCYIRVVVALWTPESRYSTTRTSSTLYYVKIFFLFDLVFFPCLVRRGGENGPSRDPNSVKIEVALEHAFLHRIYGHAPLWDVVYRLRQGCNRLTALLDGLISLTLRVRLAIVLPEP